MHPSPSPGSVRIGNHGAHRTVTLPQPRRQGPGIISRRPPCIGPPCTFHLDGTQRPDCRLAVVAQQFNLLIDELPAMLGPCTLVAPSQLPQHLLSRPRTHRFVHVGDGNRTFGATTLSAPQSKPLASNKHFGAIAGARHNSRCRRGFHKKRRGACCQFVGQSPHHECF
jgi:hypothetical protein